MFSKSKKKEISNTIRASVKSEIKKEAISKRTPFIRERMWLSYLLSMLTKDIGKIPDNIGNNVIVTNNTYITKAFISSIIHVDELGFGTPCVFTEQLVQYLRSKGSTVVVDFTIKNQRFNVQLQESGLKSRVYIWEKQIDSDMLKEETKMRAAGCLYTVDRARQGDSLFKSRIYITLRAKRGTQLTQAEKFVGEFFNSISASYTLISGDMQRYISYVSILSDSRDQALKDVKTVITSPDVLSQILPNTDGYELNKAPYFGINKNNNSLYRLDLSNITMGRNMYIVAPAGVGKTVLALNMCCSAFEKGFAVCVMDIKGNEFTYFARVTGGCVVSLSSVGTEYINSFKMHSLDVGDMPDEVYFKERFNFSKKQLLILSGVEDNEKLIKLDEFLDDFLTSVYISLGAVNSNRNSWFSTDNLTPYVVFDMLTEYLTGTVATKYGKVIEDAYRTWRQYMSKNGSSSYLFRNEFDYNEILNSNTLIFSFGLLNKNIDNMALFKLKFLYMRKLNADFIRVKSNIGKKVFKVLEESQVVDDDIMQSYVEEITLRRAQGQSTVLLGNSVTALNNRVAAAPIIENMKGIFIGDLPPDAKNVAVKAFNLEPYQELIDTIGSSEEYQNSFVFINRMQPNSLTPILKVELEEGKVYKLFTPEKI